MTKFPAELYKCGQLRLDANQGCTGEGLSELVASLKCVARLLHPSPYFTQEGTHSGTLMLGLTL